MVVSRDEPRGRLSWPAFMRTKQPVPYVFFAMPGAKQAWPKRAACWSPAMPPIGMAAPRSEASVSPKTPEEGRTAGSSDGGTPSSRRMSSSQASREMLKSRVREALE